MNKKTVLIVDDDRTERRMIGHILRRTFDVDTIEAEHGNAALQTLKEHGNIHLMILDFDMPVMGGLETLETALRRYPRLPIIMLTGETDTRNVVKAMKLGAYDFLAKPVEQARLDVSVRNALKTSLMSEEILRLKRKASDEVQFSDLIGHEQGLVEHIKIGHKAALCNLPVLLTGETGTGKEMFARAIHGESQRTTRPFVAVNCGALPEKLVESTLFGHEKGAFTGAINKAPGKFQEAHGGTIFLDEVGELPLDAQVKLLRALQDGNIEPIGAAKTVPVNVRVISATNRDLSEEVQAGRFREDLFFRLNVIHIDLPPLRARTSDIPAMATHFIEEFCADGQTIPKKITPPAMQKLQNHNWPGNVRELENIINRAMALCDHAQLEPDDFSFIHAVGEIPQALPDGFIATTYTNGAFKSLHDLEQEIVALALMHHDGNISKTAKILGIAKSTLYAKMDAAKEDLKSA